jgi:NhaA family Na+:H+ antiporter
MLQSGVHATVAGILLAFFIPLRTRNAADEVPLDRLEHAINPWVTFMILPLFGFANAGVALSGMTMNDLLSPVPVGVALGLFLGKQAGIFGLSLLAVSLGLAKRPEKSTWLQVYGVSVLWDWFYHEPVYRQSGLYRQPSAR